MDKSNGDDKRTEAQKRRMCPMMITNAQQLKRIAWVQWWLWTYGSSNQLDKSNGDDERMAAQIN